MAFTDQVAIVTGGASGIGRALAEELSRRGALVVVADINAAGAQRVAEAIAARGGHAVATHVDVRDAGRVRALVDETARSHGRLDFMFNNAGIGARGEVRDLTLDQWRTVIDINLMGVIYGATAAYAVMLRQRSGHIVNIASMAGLIASPGLAPYATAKSAVVGLSAALRAEGEGLGVRVSVVCPGFVDTAIFENSIGVEAEKSELLKRLPLRLVPVEDAARAILRGVERNRETIVFPRSARLLWRMHRISPALLAPFRRRMIAGMRALRKE